MRSPPSTSTRTPGSPTGAKRIGALSANATVKFRIRDAYHPPAHELLGALFGERRLQGRVTAVSLNGEPGGGFAVVQVEGVGEPVIVPLSSVEAWPEG